MTDAVTPVEAPAQPAPAAAAPAPAPVQPAAPAAAPAAPAPVAAATPAAPAAPVNYDLSAAGFDPEITAGLVEQARAAGLAPDAAAAQAKGLSTFVATINERAARAAVAKADAELRADPEFGGANYDQTLATAKAAAQSLGGDALLAELDRTGLGNSPTLIKALATLAKSGVVKGEFVAGGNARDGGEKPSAAIFYGDSMK